MRLCYEGLHAFYDEFNLAFSIFVFVFTFFFSFSFHFPFLCRFKLDCTAKQQNNSCHLKHLDDSFFFFFLSFSILIFFVYCECRCCAAFVSFPLPHAISLFVLRITGILLVYLSYVFFDSNFECL